VDCNRRISAKDCIMKPGALPIPPWPRHASNGAFCRAERALLKPMLVGAAEVWFAIRNRNAAKIGTLIILLETCLRISPNSRSSPNRVRTGCHHSQRSTPCSRKLQPLFVSLFMRYELRCYPDCGVERACAVMKAGTLHARLMLTRQTSQTTSIGLHDAGSR